MSVSDVGVEWDTMVGEGKCEVEGLELAPE